MVGVTERLRQSETPGRSRSHASNPADAPFAEDRCEELTYRNYSLEALEGREQ